MENQVRDLVFVFISILYEALPFIVLGALIAGLLEELVPQQFVTRIIPRNRFLAIAIGGILGVLFPMCECGIIPVMRRLLRKGVPLSCCVCYMLAGPIINFVVMLSTYWAFRNIGTSPPLSGSQVHQLGGWEMMTLRMVLGFLVAFGTSLIVEWQHRKHGNKLLAPMVLAGLPALPTQAEKEQGDSVPAKRWSVRLANISETALHDFVDITVFLILGAILAALPRLFYNQDQLAATFGQNFGLAILVMMGLAIVLCICSEADAFVAASFQAMPPSAKLAFLVLGPMLDLKLYMMYTRVFRPRLIWTIIISVVIQVLIYAFLTHFFLEDLGGAVWLTGLFPKKS